MLPCNGCFDTISAWYPCMPESERNVTELLISLTDSGILEVDPVILDASWIAGGAPATGKRRQVFDEINDIRLIEKLDGEGNPYFVYEWNMDRYIDLVIWYHTPGVNKDVCVQRMYPKSPRGFQSYPPKPWQI